jgi:hypothetical protein
MLASQFAHQCTLADGGETDKSTAVVSICDRNPNFARVTYTLATPVRATSKPAVFKLAPTIVFLAGILTSTTATTSSRSQKFTLELSKLRLQLTCRLSETSSIKSRQRARTQVERGVLVLLSPSHLGLDLLDLYNITVSNLFRAMRSKIWIARTFSIVVDILAV